MEIKIIVKHMRKKFIFICLWVPHFPEETQSGFTLLAVHGGTDFSEPDEQSERWHLVARAIKN